MTVQPTAKLLKVQIGSPRWIDWLLWIIRQAAATLRRPNYYTRVHDGNIGRIRRRSSETYRARRGWNREQVGPLPGWRVHSSCTRKKSHRAARWPARARGRRSLSIPARRGWTWTGASRKFPSLDHSHGYLLECSLECRPLRLADR